MRVQSKNVVVCCRVFGTAFAELPFVATRDGYRRDGNLTRLMHASSWPISRTPTVDLHSMTVKGITLSVKVAEVQAASFYMQ